MVFRYIIRRYPFLDYFRQALMSSEVWGRVLGSSLRSLFSKRFNNHRGHLVRRVSDVTLSWGTKVQPLSTYWPRGGVFEICEVDGGWLHRAWCEPNVSHTQVQQDVPESRWILVSTYMQAQIRGCGLMTIIGHSAPDIISRIQCRTRSGVYDGMMRGINRQV
jgi:hypothetical protein